MQQYHLRIPRPQVQQHSLRINDEGQRIELRFDTDLVSLLQSLADGEDVGNVNQIIQTPVADADQEADEDELEQARRVMYTLITFANPETIEMDDYEFNSMIAQHVGNVEIGVSDIKQVTTEVLQVDPEEMCAVCQEMFADKNNDEKVLKTICSHIYCEGCLTKWLQKSKRCPVCMIDLEELKEKKQI